MDKRGDASKRILTVPNVLSMFRILLVPVIIYLYVIRKDETGAAVVLLISAVTDIVDGWIARTFNQVTDFGKFIDPCADKLTQFTMLCCLITKWHSMLIPATILVIKEMTDAYTSMWVIKNTNQVMGAEWHGKLATVIIHSTIVLHVIWPDIPQTATTVCIVLCAVAMLLSLMLYTIRNARAVLRSKAENQGKRQ